MKRAIYFLGSLILTLLFWSSFISFAQTSKTSTKVIQFFGMVQHKEDGTMKPLGLVTVRVKNQMRATFTNPKGGFSIAVLEGDTLQFSHVGFKAQYYVIPKSNNPDVQFSYMDIEMEQEIFELPEYAAKALPTRAQFERDFVNMNVKDDLTSIATNNITNESLVRFIFSVPVDGSEASRMQLNRQIDNYTHYNQLPSVRLFDPFAWAQFIKEVKSGAIKLK